MINDLDRLRIFDEDFCNPRKWRSPEYDEERSQDVHISQSILEMIDVLSETARINCETLNVDLLCASAKLWTTGFSVEKKKKQ